MLVYPHVSPHAVMYCTYIRTYAWRQLFEHYETGIRRFWEDQVDVLHLHKVFPKVIESEGGPTGY